MDVIKYQCSHCNTLYDSVDRCPTCGSLTEDAIQINYTQNIKNRKKELALDTYFTPIYQLVCVVHLLTCLSWFGLWLSIPTTILHVIHIFIMKKKKAADSPNKAPELPQKKFGIFSIISILDMVLCVPSFLVMLAMILFEIFPLY